jgi:hypothetical protein
VFHDPSSLHAVVEPPSIVYPAEQENNATVTSPLVDKLTAPPLGCDTVSHRPLKKCTKMLLKAACLQIHANFHENFEIVFKVF